MGCSGSKDKEAPTPAAAEPTKKDATLKAARQSEDSNTLTSAKQDGTTTLKAPVNPLKNALAASKAAAETEDPSATLKKVAEKHLSKDAGSRLQVASAVPTVTSKLEEQEKNKASTEKLFDAPKGPEKSKIWKALNPNQIAYQSRREKEEEGTEKWSVEIRGGGRSAGGGVSYQKMQDENGNMVDVLEDEDEEEEEEVDLKSLPNFGEFQAEMDAKRLERQKKLEEKQLSLKRSYTERKNAEQAAIDKEMAIIKAKAAQERQLKEAEENRIMAEVQSRLNDSSQFQFDFKFGN